MPTDAAERALWRIRLLHTLAWTIFAGSILLIPLATITGMFDVAVWLSLLVWAEVAVLAVNHMRCPLTGLAARYNEDRSDNFDIFLPRWLAKHNKLVFGLLFAAGEIFLLLRWMLSHAG